MAESNSVETISAHLADVAAGASIPESAMDAAHRGVIDTFACIAAGRSTDVTAMVTKVAATWGGEPTSTVWGMQAKLPDYLAAFVNASMVHQFDFDDTHDTAVCHPTSGSLVAALAVAEARGRVSGETLLRAVAAGNDLTSRIALAIDGGLWDFPWVRAPVAGIFGATAAAGVILGLDDEKMHAALGLALPQASGTLESVIGHRSMVRSLRDGFAYKDAVIAARMAEAGIVGDDRVFDGPYGLFGAYFDGKVKEGVLLHRLGEHFEGENVSLKPWPSCRHTHATITALLDIIADPANLEREVAHVRVHVGSGNLRLCEGKEWPTNHIDALCNLPFIVAAGVVNRAIPLAAFEAEGRADESVKAAHRKISWVHDPSHDRHGTIEPGRVVVEFADGKQVTGVADRALGHPSNPMSSEQLTAKWQDCVAWGQPEVSDTASERILDMLENVREIDDVTYLGNLGREVWVDG